MLQNIPLQKSMLIFCKDLSKRRSRDLVYTHMRKKNYLHFPYQVICPKAIRPLSTSVSTSHYPSCSDTIVRDVGLLAEENYARLRAMENRRQNSKKLTKTELDDDYENNYVGREKSKKRSYEASNSSQTSRWHLIDAKDQIVGRLASQIASILRGKHKPTFTPARNSGDFVVVINAKNVVFTGRKMKDKKYYWHTLHPGGLKFRTPKQYIERGNPEEILRHAVLGMLPKNSLRNEAIKKLRIFPDKYHIYAKKLKDKTDILQ